MELWGLRRSIYTQFERCASLTYDAVGFRCTSDPVAISQSFSSSSGRSAGGGNSVAVGTVADGKVYQSVNVGDTADYDFSVYVYDNTSGHEGQAISDDGTTSTIASLYYNGATISTTYTDAGSGWWKLTGTLTGAAESREYGLLVKAGKTVIADDFSLTSVYDASGTLASNIFDTSQLSAWGTLSYTATTPTNTTISVKARSSSDSGMSGATAFSSCTAITSGTDISGNSCMTDGHRYVQYELTLATTDTSATPTFSDITINYTPFDTTAPAISLTALSPDPGSDTTPSLTGTATDTTSTVSAVQFQMDSTAGSWTACTASDGAFDEASEAFTCTPASALSDGAHTMYVRATDSLSNTTTSGSESTDSFTIDTVASSISLTAISPDPGTNTKPTIAGTATDVTSTISTVQFQVDATSGSWSSCTATDGTFASATESFTCAVTTALSDGSHTIYIRSTDNASNTSSSASDSFTVDTTGPVSKDLDYPSDGSYINTTRPTFKWKAFADATSGLSSYSLEVSRADSDSNTENTGFTISGIEVSRTTTNSTSKYNVGYENFSDSDDSNNYITVLTKSSSDWGSENNDGRLKQGKYNWKITATDKAGNTVTSSKAFYVDLTNPALTATVENLGEAIDGYKVTTNLKPKITGTLTDNFIADKIRFAFYKRNYFLGIEASQSLYTLETLNHPNSATTSWSYNFSPSQHLDYGKYALEITGYDKAGNASTILRIPLQVLTDSGARIALLKAASEKDTGKVIEKIREKTAISLPQLEKQAKIRRNEEAVNLTRLTEENARLLARITSGISKLLASMGSFISPIHNTPIEPIISVLTRPIFAANTYFISMQRSVKDSFSTNWNNRGIPFKKAMTAFELAYRSMKEPAARSANFLYRVRVAIDTSDAILFDAEPTQIDNIVLDHVGKDSAVVSWDTNHFTKNNKVNYGLDLTYGQEAWGENYSKHHTITLTDLKPGTKYFFEVMSQNKNYTYDAYYVFETGK